MEQETFPNFNEIQHTPLRVYNRVVMMNNIAADFGQDEVRSYINQFDQTERRQMFLMQSYIRKFGQDEAMKMVTKEVDFEDSEPGEYVH